MIFPSFLTCDLDELCEGADRIREACIGDKVDLCSIINGRSGRCPEDCKYCAQSAHHHTSCEVYNFLPEEKILAIDADPAIGLATALGIEPKLTLDDIRNEIVANVEDGNTKEAMELLSESRYKIAEAIVEKRRFCVSCNRTSGVSRMLLPHQFIFKRSDHDDLRAV